MGSVAEEAAVVAATATAIVQDAAGFQVVTGVGSWFGAVVVVSMRGGEVVVAVVQRRAG